MKFGSKSDAFDVANLLNHKVLGTRLRSDGTHLIPLDKTPDIVKIPEFPDLVQATKFVQQHHTPSCNETLGIVTYNDNMVILNSNHTASDGGYLMELNKYILGESKLEDKHSQMSISLEDAFSDYLQNISGEANFDSSSFNYTLTTTPKKDTDPAAHYRFVIPHEQLKAFNKNTKKVKNITDNIWTSFILSTAAHNGYLDKYGVYVCVNLRPYLSKTTFEHADIFARKAVAVPMKDRNETLQSVCSRFRKIFDSKQALDDLFRFIKNSNFKSPLLNSLNLETSNVGVFKATGPILDISASLLIPNNYSSGELCFLTYTVDHGKSKELICQLRHPTNSVSTDEVSKLASSIKYFLKNMDFYCKVGDVFDELTKYQSSL
ncbi:hypothetical protein TVAG_416710 [Trichomonas vaginalis G3]|uniref:Uncharacterized protein n=1 Tax=Trichomonas vaginalis (strain ATCC PRA-98 / G3) TaxID=412133 RepID=A2EQR3_TRIV3|nr:hypothetical protein TVAG_416710 [Trichomonas vaginalis G3]|eukprot:XP_001317251.1 hypothetical protein [Trichomonas vaginalis G3]